MTKRTLIVDLQANQFVEGVFAIQNCQLGQTKAGKPFIKCLIADRSKRVPGRMWNATEELFASLPTDGFVRLEGQTQPYQGEMQIIIQMIQPAQPSAEDLRELLPRTSRDIDQMLAEVMTLLRAMEDPHLRDLAEAYLADQTLLERFQQAPAAMTLHHAYLGGLLEHTLSLLNLAKAVGPLYPQVNRDLVMMGLFLHDLGKCVELTWHAGFGYSEEGHLVGHIAQGVLELQRKADQCAAQGKKIPHAVLMVLQHIILSHHGKAEYGALKIPATPEAIAVALLDNLDAKMHMAIVATRNPDGSAVKGSDLGGNFTEKVWALDTRLYRPDPTTILDDE